MTIQRIELPLTISTSQYAAGDVVGGLLTISTERLRGGGLLNKVVVVDDDNEKAALNLWLFNAPPSTFADNAAFAPTIADLKRVVMTVAIEADAYVTVNSNAIAIVPDVNDLAAVSPSLYGYLVAVATPTYAAPTDLWLALDFLPEPRGSY